MFFLYRHRDAAFNLRVTEETIKHVEARGEQLSGELKKLGEHHRALCERREGLRALLSGTPLAVPPTEPVSPPPADVPAESPSTPADPAPPPSAPLAVDPAPPPPAEVPQVPAAESETAPSDTGKRRGK